MGNTTGTRGPGRPPKQAKRERTSFASSRMRLQIDLIPEVAKEYFPRWFNDSDDRLQRALSAEWQFIYKNEIVGHVGDKEVHGDSSDLNNRVTKVVDKQGTVAYAMKLRHEFRKEDQAELAAKNNLVDEAIRAGQSGGASVARQYGSVNLTRR